MGKRAVQQEVQHRHALPEFVVQLARQGLAFVFLHREQVARQLFQLAPLQLEFPDETGTFACRALEIREQFPFQRHVVLDADEMADVAAGAPDREKVELVPEHGAGFAVVAQHAFAGGAIA